MKYNHKDDYKEKKKESLKENLNLEKIGHNFSFSDLKNEERQTVKKGRILVAGKQNDSFEKQITCILKDLMKEMDIEKAGNEIKGIH